MQNRFTTDEKGNPRPEFCAVLDSPDKAAVLAQAKTQVGTEREGCVDVTFTLQDGRKADARVIVNDDVRLVVFPDGLQTINWDDRKKIALVYLHKKGEDDLANKEVWDKEPWAKELFGSRNPTSTSTSHEGSAITPPSPSPEPPRAKAKFDPIIGMAKPSWYQNKAKFGLAVTLVIMVSAFIFAGVMAATHQPREAASRAVQPPPQQSPTQPSTTPGQISFVPGPEDATQAQPQAQPQPDTETEAEAQAAIPATGDVESSEPNTDRGCTGYDDVLGGQVIHIPPFRKNCGKDSGANTAAAQQTAQTATGTATQRVATLKTVAAYGTGKMPPNTCQADAVTNWGSRGIFQYGVCQCEHLVAGDASNPGRSRCTIFLENDDNVSHKIIFDGGAGKAIDNYGEETEISSSFTSCGGNYTPDLDPFKGIACTVTFPDVSNNNSDSTSLSIYAIFEGRSGLLPTLSARYSR